MHIKVKIKEKFLNSFWKDIVKKSYSIGAPINNNGPAKDIWDIEAKPQSLFKDENKFLEVPNTAKTDVSSGKIKKYNNSKNRELISS